MAIGLGVGKFLSTLAMTGNKPKINAWGTWTLSTNSDRQVLSANQNDMRHVSGNSLPKYESGEDADKAKTRGGSKSKTTRQQR